MTALWVALIGAAMKKAAHEDRLFKQRLERVKRFELSTSTLARLRSTPELHPLTGH
jgi:hypothetical protein